MKKALLMVIAICLGFGLAQAQEMIIDGTFDIGSDAWIVEANDGGVLLYEIVDGQAHLTVDGQGANPWSTQFKQKVTLENGKKYDVSFDMKAIPFIAGEAIGIGVWLQQDHPDFILVDEQLFNPTTEWQTFSYTSVEWSEDDDEDAKITFVFSEAYLGDEIWLDNVSLSEEGTLVGIEDELENQSSKFSLSQNCPNPFNPSTTINFDLPSNEYVSLKIYDISGRLVKTLANHTMQAGSHSFNWDSRNESGMKVPSGIYFYTIEAGDYSKTVKMTLMK